jgi:hypothetical protein
MIPSDMRRGRPFPEFYWKPDRDYDKSERKFVCWYGQCGYPRIRPLPKLRWTEECQRVDSATGTQKRGRGCHL